MRIKHFTATIFSISSLIVQLHRLEMHEEVRSEKHEGEEANFQFISIKINSTIIKTRRKLSTTRVNTMRGKE